MTRYRALIHACVLTIPVIWSVATWAQNNSDAVNQSAQALLKQALELRKESPSDGVAAARQALKMGNRSNNKHLQAQALYTLGLITKTLKDYNQADKYLRNANQLIPEINDDLLAIDIWLNLGDVQRFVGSVDEAEVFAEQALKLAVKHKDIARQRNIYNIRGNIRKSIKAYPLAAEHFKHALRLARQVNEPRLIAQSAANLAEMYYKLRDYENTRDTLLIAIPYYEEVNDEKKLTKLYRKLGRAYDSLDEAALSTRYYRKALLLIKDAGDPEETAEILEYMASNQRRTGEYGPALENAKWALRIQREYGNTQHITQILLNITSIYRKLSSYDSALEYANEMLSIFERSNDIDGISSASHQVGLIHSRLEQYDLARSYFERSLSVYEGHPKKANKPNAIRGRAAALRGIADILQKQDRNEESIVFAQEARQLFRQVKSIHGVETVSRTLAQIYENLNRPDEALASYYEALELSRESSNRWGEATNLSHIGKLTSQKNPKEGIKIIKQALSIANDLSAKSVQLDCYLALARVENLRGNYRQALEYSNTQYKLSREISKEETNQRIAELQIIRETETHEREIESLKRQSQINALELTRQSSELQILNKQKTIAGLQLERERFARLLLIGLTLVILLALALLFSRYRYSRQRQNMLNEKNAQIESKNSKLEELNATKDRFFSIIAHDLRGPISSLVSLTEVLEVSFDSYTKDQLRKYINSIHESTEQTYNLLNDLLEWAMLQLRNTDPIPRHHNIGEMCLQVIKTMDSIAQSKSISIRHDIDPDLSVFADRNMINTVIRNLLANALKFTPQNGSIEIFTKSSETSVTIHVKDYGIGISNKDMQDIFRIDKLISRKGTDGEKGTGFGLALCKDLIQKNGGEIHAVSQKNEGSDFFFTLPISGPKAKVYHLDQLTT